VIIVNPNSGALGRPIATADAGNTPQLWDNQLTNARNSPRPGQD
jgi:hypothetical protein